MLLALAFNMILSTQDGTLGMALTATEAPNTLRAAFTVELSSDAASYTIAFDPRLPETERWQVIARSGQDADLDDVAAQWAAEAAPDGRLFPDDLRASVASSVHGDMLGPAWRVRYDHVLSANDTTSLDAWAAETLEATAWIDPITERFLRIDQELPSPISRRGGKLNHFRQTYLLETEPTWNLSYVSTLSVSFEARAGLRRIARKYEARVTDVEFFFASRAAERAYLREISTGATTAQ